MGGKGDTEEKEGRRKERGGWREQKGERGKERWRKGVRGVGREWGGQRSRITSLARGSNPLLEAGLGTLENRTVFLTSGVG